MLRTLSTQKRVLTAIGLALTCAGTPAAANDFSIEISNDDISVQASNASLQEVLEELERLTGIPVVTLNVGLTNIENAIGKITPNHMIVHEKLDGKQVIKELIIIPGGEGGASGGGGSGSAFLPNGEPAPNIEQPDQSLPQPTDQQQPATVELPAPGDAPLAEGTDQSN